MMSGQSHTATVTIVNPQGLHMRPAYLFAEMAARYTSRIEVVKDDMRIDGKSVLSILTLGAAQGTTVELVGTGPDACDAIETLANLVNLGFPGETENGAAKQPKPGNGSP